VTTARINSILTALLLGALLGASNALAQSAVKSSPLHNLELFAGLDGSKQPQDLGINANMGVRLAGNIGLPAIEKAGIGVQFGAAANFSDAAVHVLDQIEGTSRRTQTFLTVGLFDNAAGNFSWALGYDLLRENYYDTFQLGQVRGDAGYALGTADQVGVWFTKSAQRDHGVMGTTAVRLEAISQANAYLRHTWPTLGRTTVWAGMAAHHSDIVWVLPLNASDEHVLVYGGSLELPLSDRISVTGSANLLTPAATGTVDAFLGFTFYPQRGKPQLTRGRFAPPLPVANNPTFAVDLSR
jgi:hypothetical protein